jgi:hypothetical protein
VELDVGELRDAVDRQEHDQLAMGMAQLAAVDMHVADLVSLEPLARLSRLGCRKTRDALLLQTTMQGGATEPRDRVTQAAQNIVEWQQCPPPELNHNRFFGRCQDRASGRLRSHWRIRRHRPFAPFRDCLGVQSVLGSKGAVTFLRRLELGSDTRRRAGAAVKNS